MHILISESTDTCTEIYFTMLFDIYFISEIILFTEHELYQFLKKLCTFMIFTIFNAY